MPSSELPPGLTLLRAMAEVLLGLLEERQQLRQALGDLVVEYEAVLDGKSSWDWDGQRRLLEIRRMVE